MTHTTEALAVPAQDEPILSRPLRLRLLGGALVLLSLVYCVQVLSPLRLNTDAVTLLRMSDSFRAGEGFTVEHRTTQFPVGYPFSLAMLETLGIARSSTFVAFNLLCLGGALLLFARIAMRECGLDNEMAMFVIVLTLGSFSTIKHITLPLTEPQFMLLSMLALDQLSLWSSGRSTGQSRKVWHIALAMVFIAVAICTRMIGIALLPAAAWAMLRGSALGRVKLSKQMWIALSVATLVGLTIIVWMVVRSEYISQLNALRLGPGHFFHVTLVLRFIDAIQLALNLPGSILIPSIPVFCIGAGAILFMCIGIKLPAKWNLVDVYVYAYAAIMFLWPFQDPRFWNPVMPFLFLMAGLAVSRICGGYVRIGLITFYCVCYAATGLAAILYSTQLTFAGASFADVYGVDAIHASYQSAMGRPITGFSHPDPTVVNILREYEPLAKPGK